MIEARVFVDSLDPARNILSEERAELQGSYIIRDTIYRNVDGSIPLAEEFLRLREIPQNIWDEKPVILALKQTLLRKVGKKSHIPIKLQFDIREDASKYYDMHFKDAYKEDFDFRREGWQYFLPNGDVVDLEIIESKHCSIEFKSETDSGVERLLEKFGVAPESVILGPSITAVQAILNATR